MSSNFDKTSFDRGSHKDEKWICSYAENLKPCHKPAMWVIQCGELGLGACGAHRDQLKASLVPEIRIWDVQWLTGERR